MTGLEPRFTLAKRYILDVIRFITKSRLGQPNTKVHRGQRGPRTQSHRACVLLYAWEFFSYL